jgi:hypothetical protein
MEGKDGGEGRRGRKEGKEGGEGRSAAGMACTMEWAERDDTMLYDTTRRDMRTREYTI